MWQCLYTLWEKHNTMQHGFTPQERLQCQQGKLLQHLQHAYNLWTSKVLPFHIWLFQIPLQDSIHFRPEINEVWLQTAERAASLYKRRLQELHVGIRPITEYFYSAHHQYPSCRVCSQASTAGYSHPKKIQTTILSFFLFDMNILYFSTYT